MKRISHVFFILCLRLRLRLSFKYKMQVTSKLTVYSMLESVNVNPVYKILTELLAGIQAISKSTVFYRQNDGTWR